jgi:tRNA/rRNA methyltransferase
VPKTDRTGSLNTPVIVLVRPQLGENIGKAARAMLNFGLTELRLVTPRDGWPNPSAGPAAAGADIVLEQARVYATTAEAVADCAHVHATTVRKRGVTKPVIGPDEAGRQVHTLAGRHAILFGPEPVGAGNRRRSAGAQYHHRANQPRIRLAQSGAGGDTDCL